MLQHPSSTARHPLSSGTIDTHISRSAGNVFVSASSRLYGRPDAFNWRCARLVPRKKYLVFSRDNSSPTDTVGRPSLRMTSRIRACNVGEKYAAPSSTFTSGEFANVRL